MLISGIALAYGIKEIITKDADFKTIEEIYMVILRSACFDFTVLGLLDLSINRRRP